MANKLFVGSLPFATTSDELKELFAQAGEVAEANIVTDKMTGRSRGFGFVEMANDADAQKAISALDGTDFEGRRLGVSVAKPREDKPRNDKFSSGNRGGFNNNNRYKTSFY